MFDHFLVTPLLDINPNNEQKFSSNKDVAHNTDPLGHIVDAYVHHVLVDSLEDMLLADVQGMFLTLPLHGILMFMPLVYLRMGACVYLTLKPIHKPSMVRSKVLVC